jgi:hypothetical protein
MDYAISDLSPTIEIEPGIYEVRLFQDEEEEIKHMFPNQVINYPANDGPDWCLVLKKVAEPSDSNRRTP